MGGRDGAKYRNFGASVLSLSLVLKVANWHKVTLTL